MRKGMSSESLMSVFHLTADRDHEGDPLLCAGTGKHRTDIGSTLLDILLQNPVLAFRG